MEQYGRIGRSRSYSSSLDTLFNVVPPTEPFMNGLVYEIQTLTLLPVCGFALHHAWSQVSYTRRGRLVKSITFMALLQGCIAIYRWRAYDQDQLLGRIFMDALCISALTAFRHFGNFPPLQRRPQSETEVPDWAELPPSERPRRVLSRTRDERNRELDDWKTVLVRVSVCMNVITTLRAGVFVFLLTQSTN